MIKVAGALKRAGIVIGTVMVLWIVLAFVQRRSIALLWLFSTPLLIVTSVKRPERLCFRSGVACVVAMMFACVPADIIVARSGRPGVSLKPVMWGYPTEETGERIEAGEVVWGGCVVPVNPVRYAVRISF